MNKRVISVKKVAANKKTNKTSDPENNFKIHEGNVLPYNKIIHKLKSAGSKERVIIPLIQKGHIKSDTNRHSTYPKINPKNKNDTIKNIFPLINYLFFYDIYHFLKPHKFF